MKQKIEGGKKREFDVRVEMTVKVMPREYISGVGEKIMWDGIENDLNFEAKLLGKSLEKYFDSKARIIIEYKNQMTKPQKIEGGWVEEFILRFGHCGGDKKRELERENLINFISDLLASERQRCKTKIVDYFAGSGELWFPYIGVGVETKEEEKECVKQELSELLEQLK